RFSRDWSSDVCSSDLDPQVRPSRLTMRAVVTDDGMGDATVALEVCRLDLPTITGSAFRCPMDPAATLDIAILTSDAFGALLPTLDRKSVVQGRRVQHR